MKRSNDMTNLRKIQWWKAILMLIVTAFFLYLSAEVAQMLRNNYSNWIVNRDDVQTRAYEALGLLSLAADALLISVSCFIASLRSLIHCFFPPKRPSIFARLTARYGGYPALISFVIFAILCLVQVALGNMIGNTPDIDEVPATLGYRIISCRIDIPLVLAFEATIVMLVSWIQNKLRKKGK